MDIADIAEMRIERELEEMLASRVVYQGESATECDECGEEIPEGRRIAIQGCRLCVECQGIADKRMRG